MIINPAGIRLEDSGFYFTEDTGEFGTNLKITEDILK